jgi:hypothetical protein
VTVGECIGTIHDLRRVGDVVHRVVDDAAEGLAIKLSGSDADVTGMLPSKPWITLMLVSLATTSSPASGTNDVVLVIDRSGYLAGCRNLQLQGLVTPSSHA